MITEMDESAAWRDFYDNFLPSIRKGLSRKDAQAIDTAERDFHGLRKGPNGKHYALGPDRVGRILSRLAPGRYEVEKRVVFRVVFSENSD